MPDDARRRPDSHPDHVRGWTADQFIRQIEALEEGVEDLRQQAREAVALPEESAALLGEVLESLSVSVEELAAAGKQLRQQADDLAGSRQAVETERERYRDLFEFTPEAYLVTDERGLIREANRAATALFGYARVMLIGKPLAVLIAEEDRAAFRSRLADPAGRQDRRTWEVRLKPRAGDLFPADVTVAPMRSAGAGPTGLRWLIRDITHRKQTEEALRASEAKYRHLFENLNDAAFLADAETGMILETNRRGEGLLGRSRDEILALHQSQLHPPGKGDEYRHRFAEHVKAGHAADDDGEVIRKDGTVVPVNIRAGTFSLEGRDVLLGLFRDNTQRKRAEEALRESRERYRLATTAARVGVWDWNLQTGAFYLDPAVKALLGYRDDEIPNDLDVWVTYVHPDDREAVMAAAQAHLEGKTPAYVFEHRMIHKDGSVRWTLVRGEAIRDADGRVIRMVGTDADITDRKRAEEALRESEERFRLLTDYLPGVSIQGYRTDGTVFYWNRASEDVYGYTAEEAVGRNLGDLIVPPALKQAFQECLSAGRGVTASGEFWPAGELLLRDKDGRPVPVYSTHTAVCVAGHEPLLYCIDLDLSKRKAAEAERARLATAVEQAAEAVVIRDADRIIQYVNPAFERMTGYTREEVVGVDPSPFRGGVHDEGFFRGVWAAAARDGVWTGRITNRRKDGVLLETETTVSAVRDAGGEITNYVSIKRDVTREVHLEEQLRQAAKMEAIGQLAGGIAHDFNNLLTGILGHANLLKVTLEPDSPAQEAAGTIERAAERAATLTGQLLGFARRGKHQNVPVNLHHAVQRVIAFLGRTVDPRISMTQRLRAEHAVILGDPGQIEQMLLNLGLNARDAMPDGGELIFETDEVDLDRARCEAHTGAVPGRYLALAVADTGVGIPHDVRDRIFEPFFTTKQPGVGTGMGLATVYGIATNHGGWLDVESQVGEGTTFTVYLPLSPGAGPATTGEAPGEPVHGTGRILLVDDEPVVRDVATRILRHLGYQVVTAADGQEAIDYFRRLNGEIDLVIVDLVMPVMNGRDCFRALKEIDPEVQAVLSTGFGLDGQAQETLDEGMVGFAQKPYRIGQLSRVVAAALREEPGKPGT